MSGEPGCVEMASGRLSFSSPPVSIGDDLMLESLWALPLGALCEEVTRNPPWDLIGYRYAEAGGERFSGLICFKGGKVEFVTLMSQRPEFGTSWADFSRAKENARQAFHNQWLGGQLGSAEPVYSAEPSWPSWEWKFPWGRIISGWDTKNGTTEITIRYGAGTIDG